MRPIALTDIFKESNEILKFTADRLSKSNSPYDYRIKNWKAICNVLNNLYNYKFLQSYISEIFNLEINFNLMRNDIVLPESIHNTLSAKVKNLRDTIDSYLIFLSEYYIADTDDQINIKIPNNVSLPELSDIIGELDFIFNKCAYINELNDKNEVVLKKVESGSIIVCLSIAAIAIPIIGQLANIAKGISSSIQQYKITEQQLRIIKSTANVVEVAAEEMKKMIENQSREEAEKIYPNDNSGNYNERLTSLSKVVEKMANLSYKGVSFSPPLNSSEEILNKFPYQEEIPSLPKEILKLKDNNSEES